MCNNEPDEEISGTTIRAIWKFTEMLLSERRASELKVEIAVLLENLNPTQRGYYYAQTEKIREEIEKEA